MIVPILSSRVNGKELSDQETLNELTSLQLRKHVLESPWRRDQISQFETFERWRDLVQALLRFPGKL